MDRAELLAKIAPFPLLARGLATDLLSGSYRSVFKGQGIEFDEVRRYEAEDDARSIDWNVSARFGIPYVKMYREEREMTVCIILDTSASMHTSGGSELNHYEQGVLAAALVAFSAEQSGQRLSAIFFDKEIRRIFPPRKGRSHAMAFVSAALENRPLEKGTGLGAALAGAGRLLKRRSLVIIISDFLSLNWEHEMADISRQHDVMAIRICGPVEKEIPLDGFFTLEDPETGMTVHSPAFTGFRSAWTNWHENRQQLWEAICRRSGAACLNLSTVDDASAAIAGFFRRNWERGQA
ncbi:MAG: DUF58 domain-containing protein [Treponema sp.]|jgi:uncharacterized protein (DUF58 family)|nr:DUF58 domain-containing protein [Treponema sp.]